MARRAEVEVRRDGTVDEGMVTVGSVPRLERARDSAVAENEKAEEEEEETHR